MRIIGLAFALLALAPMHGLSAETIVVITHPAVPARSISKDRLANLFLASSPAWPDGKPAVPFDLGYASVRDGFYARVLGRPPAQVRAYRARQIFSGTGFPPAEAASADEMLKLVADTPGAIGYVPADRVDSSVRVLPVSP